MDGWDAMMPGSSRWPALLVFSTFPNLSFAWKIKATTTKRTTSVVVYGRCCAQDINPCTQTFKSPSNISDSRILPNSDEEEGGDDDDDDGDDDGANKAPASFLLTHMADQKSPREMYTWWL
jgi:hypothetical protein